nr:MarR family transcriptional regulator [Solimonas aquatica]
MRYKLPAMPKTAASDAQDRALTLDEQLCFAIYSAMHALNKVYRELLQALELTYPQYLVMLTLWEADSLTVNEIGARLFLESSTLTPLLKRLEAAGLLTRTRAAEDERQVLVTLSAAGRRLRAKARDIPACMLQAMNQHPAELRQLREQIVQLRDSLLQHAA